MIQIENIKTKPIGPDDYQKTNVVELTLENKEVHDGDIIVVTSKLVSILEGRFEKVEDVVPSEEAALLAKIYKVDPKITELVHREGDMCLITPLHKALKVQEFTDMYFSQLKDNIEKEKFESLLNSFTYVWIVKKFGFFADSAGLDRSNLPTGYVALLPKDPAESAARIRKDFYEKTGKNVAIIITDSLGYRSDTRGCWDVPIGFAGIDPLEKKLGEYDIYGNISSGGRANYVMSLASMAGAVMGNSNECTPITLFRGFPFDATPLDSKGMQHRDMEVPLSLRLKLGAVILKENIIYYLNRLRIKLLKV